MRRTGFLVVLASTLIILACGENSDTRKATTFVNDFLDHPRYTVLPVGHVEVIGRSAVQMGGHNIDLAKGEVSSDDFLLYGVLDKERLVRITANRDMTSAGSFSWNNFYDLSQRGVQRKATVELISDSSQLKCPDTITKDKSRFICIPDGSGTVEEIVRSEKFEVGTGQFWFVMGNHRWQWSELAKKIRSATGQSIDEKRKFMAIAKYDPFSKKWALENIDYAGRTESFPHQADFDGFLATATKRQPSRE